MMTRRSFFTRAVGSAAVIAIGSRILAAQDAASPQTVDSSNLFAMNQEAARTVRRPAKAGMRPILTSDQRDDLEHDIRCQCGCTLAVYTCRTTDFSCQVSPAMHRDVVALVEGGYGAQEILDAFVDAYGEQALMAPRKKGFNLLGWTAPFIVLAAGAVALVAALRRLGAGAASRGPEPRAVEASSDERARLDTAVRDDR